MENIFINRQIFSKTKVLFNLLLTSTRRETPSTFKADVDNLSFEKLNKIPSTYGAEEYQLIVDNNKVLYSLTQRKYK